VNANALSDQELLRAYAEARREAAFAELVRRHVDLVYSAAIRMVREPHLAEDVTQGVFVALAGNAAQLVKHPVLSGWLHCTARNLAAKSIRSDMRRRVREQEAVTMNELLAAESEAPWNNIAPQLDEALGELSEADREVLLLRYFEKKSAAEMAGILGVSDEAAQKRVTRATERLREVFAKRGVAAAASGQVAVITANAVQAAPAGLAAAIAATALAGTTLSTSTAIAVTKTIAMTTLQKTLVFATAAVLAGAAVYESHRAAVWQTQARELAQRPASAEAAANTEAVAELRRKVDFLSSHNAELARAFDKLNAQKQDLEKQLDQSRRSTALFRELANQANSVDTSLTNNFPSARHVMVDLGKKFRQLAELKNQDTTGMTKEQKDANDAAMMSQLKALFDAAGALKQFANASTPDSTNHADFGTCLLYGALDLNDQQFGQVYNVLQKYQDQADQQNLYKDAAAPNNAAALKQLDEQAKAELQTLLTPDQVHTFGQLSSGFGLITDSYNFQF
jgi:RNA polymerase sigma factor (sigma-70 family)